MASYFFKIENIEIIEMLPSVRKKNVKNGFKKWFIWRIVPLTNRANLFLFGHRFVQGSV
jgi:hypothetical protein